MHYENYQAMKNPTFLLLALLSFMGAKAQKGDIIFTDFYPDLTLTQGINTNSPVMLDIDYDGTNDIEFSLYQEHWWEVPMYKALNGWELCRVNDSTSLTTVTNWYSVYYPGPLISYFGMRKEVGTDCYYGWFYTYDGLTKSTKRAHTLFIDCMAYCSIPNYPLYVGQTSLTDEINENEAIAFSSVYPNPSSCLITVIGESLKQAEVFNTIGQRVATATGDGVTLQIDIAKLPAGVYFVNITDEEGRKCVRKVVKE